MYLTFIVSLALNIMTSTCWVFNTCLLSLLINEIAWCRFNKSILVIHYGDFINAFSDVIAHSMTRTEVHNIELSKSTYVPCLPNLIQKSQDQCLS